MYFEPALLLIAALASLFGVLAWACDQLEEPEWVDLEDLPAILKEQAE